MNKKISQIAIFNEKNKILQQTQRHLKEVHISFYVKIIILHILKYDKTSIF